MRPQRTLLVNPGWEVEDRWASGRTVRGRHGRVSLQKNSAFYPSRCSESVHDLFMVGLRSQQVIIANPMGAFAQLSFNLAHGGLQVGQKPLHGLFDADGFF